MTITIKQLEPQYFDELGHMLVETYSALEGMPSVADQPEYYDRLRNVSARAQSPGIRIIGAFADNTLAGGVDFITDLKYYACGISLSHFHNCAGIRLLTVSPRFRRYGIGKALTLHCIDLARKSNNQAVILHTTASMQPAWNLYESLNFTRLPEIDFNQKTLKVHGFKLNLM